MTQVTTDAKPLGGGIDAATVSPEATTKITRAELIDRIVAECAAKGKTVERTQAGGTIDVLERAVNHVRRYRRCYYFTQPELDAFHHVLDIVTPDSVNGVVGDIAPGSAYAGLNDLLLQGDEVTIEHSRRIRDEVVDCLATIQVRII